VNRGAVPRNPSRPNRARPGSSSPPPDLRPAAESDKVEGLGVAASFMSDQSLLYLGLLGEYSRATRKRHKLPFHCMHQEPIWSSCSEVSFAGAQSQPGFLQGSAAPLGSGFFHI
jgi:hypothetical protein